ncbi:putative F-box/LRR-repeat protein At5g02700 [Euphorbia lathyris]|uniref:putative F-box/LRR-repeat protein At5g02700 n=1 Tax=Euphorbia lathyris TaxID=212925 RepID=UPI003313E4C6
MITLPQHRTDEMGTKTVKMEEKEDRISALPDSVIHDILSFLPSTKKAIQTSVLSKRWQNQWTHVPVLIFGLSELGRMMLEQLHHVKELNIGRCFIKTLSALEMTGVSSPLINNKCLSFDGGPNFVENLPGIAYAIRSSPELEKLVIILHRDKCFTPYDYPDLNVSGENYWNLKGAVFYCLVSHLKIVKIYGLSDAVDLQLKLALNFVEFLLKNARVLERMVVIVEVGCGAAFMFKASQKLLSFSRSSPYAVVELLRARSPKILEYASH